MSIFILGEDANWLIQKACKINSRLPQSTIVTLSSSLLPYPVSFGVESSRNASPYTTVPVRRAFFRSLLSRDNQVCRGSPSFFFLPGVNALDLPGRVILHVHITYYFAVI